ncbi:hypothetical protein F511_38956 [Dorcoceras hygrometricum]|uniref:Uncharacterized protein n=1 Tax=Dorcoceras hygrometricum TaxID=472368 RepID=A0A2Z7AGR2_9LAMI|nr:hypothetical protein F511_38956 [Dorcoceras hygrometricum]
MPYASEMVALRGSDRFVIWYRPVPGCPDLEIVGRSPGLRLWLTLTMYTLCLSQHLAYFRSDISYSSSREPSIRILFPKPSLFIRTQIHRLPSIYAAVWNKVGGAELVSSRFFDWYHFGALGRLVEEVQSSCSVHFLS